MNTEPFLLPGGDHGCLLIHGFSGNPSEMRSLGEALAARGLTALGVRLAGHGGTPEELAAATWRDWLVSAEAGLRYLRARCRRVSIAGFSLGGALGLLLARAEPPERLLILSTPLALRGGWQINSLAVARHVVPWFYPLERADFNSPQVRRDVARVAPGTDIDDPAVQARLRREVRISLAAIDEVRQAVTSARAILPQVRAPALVMHGRDDTVASPASASEIYRRLGSPHKQLVWWDETGHQILNEGPHREAVIATAAGFLAAGGL